MSLEKSPVTEGKLMGILTALGGGGGGGGGGGEGGSPASAPKPKAGISALKRIVKKQALGKLKVASLFANILGENRNKQAAAVDAVEETKPDSDDEMDNLDAADLPDIDVLRTFSPLMVHRHVHSKTSGERSHPTTKTHYGAVLFADISGFTRLANLLSVEQLQLHISKYFKKLFDCVERFGGDILKICGDAIMIMWVVENDLAKSTLEERTACALIASLCGRDLIQSCGTYTAVHPVHQISLSLHCGVGVADVQCYWVGKSGRWEFLITGDCLAQIASTEPEAKSGEIVISSQAYELVKDYLVATVTPAGNYLLAINEIKGSEGYMEKPHSADEEKGTVGADYKIIRGLSDHPTLKFDSHREIATKYLDQFSRFSPESLPMLREKEDDVAIGLQHYVHNSARPRLQHLGKDFQMAELREVVTLFVNITGLEEDFRCKRLEVIQNVMAAIIDSLKCFGGTLRQFVVDDKGCVAIGALGVPHYTFENNAARGVEIANLLRMKIQSLGKNCSIGISCGDAFCGLVGSNHRREYAMMGSCINLAARLMCSQAEPGKIIVDSRVHDMASNILLFEDMGTVKAKGYADPVPIFSFQQTLLTPKSRLIALSTCTKETIKEYKEIVPVGRKTQLDGLRLGLRNFMDGSPGCQHQFHFLEGEEGIGKSELAKQILINAISKGARVIAALSLESYSKSDYSMIAQLVEKIMVVYEEEKIIEERASARRNLKKSMDFSPLKVLTALSNISEATHSPPGSAPRTPNGGSFVANSGNSGITIDPATGVAHAWSRSARFKHWAEENLAYSVNPRGALQKAMIHGYLVTDIVDLIGDVFHEVIPNINPVVESVNRKQRQLLLKTLLVRVLKTTFADRRRILLVENLCKSDIASATVVSDFIGSSEIAFGVLTYRGRPPESRTLEHEVFNGIRSNAYSIALPPLTMRQVAELSANILGPLYRSYLNREAISRIFSRTQGNPGLVEGLIQALRLELEEGHTPTIENLRTPGQQSIVQRFDLLDPPMQLLLKTAAVVGMVFSLHALRYIYEALAAKNDLATDGAEEQQPLTTRRRTIEASTRRSTAQQAELVVAAIQLGAADLNANRDAMGFGASILPLNLDKMVDLALFEVTDFVEVTPIHHKRNGPLNVPFEYPGGDHDNAFDEADLSGMSDTPEISAQSIIWQDARGNKRRGWFAIAKDSKEALKEKASDLRKSMKDRTSTHSPSEMTHGSDKKTTRLTQRRGGAVTESYGVLSVRPGKDFFRFSHPSIQTTAYALSLELDRVPVHAAIIDYLALHFKNCPGLEESCLHHALHLKDPIETLFWLSKCAVAARDTKRHTLFIQRATQLLSFLIRGESRLEMDLDSQAFQMCKSYNKHFTGNGKVTEPTTYTYDMENREPPNWSDESSDDGWLLTIGAIMRDLMCAMIVTGDVKVLDQLGTMSLELLGGMLVRGHETQGADSSQALMTSYRALLNNSQTRRGSSYLLELNLVPEQKLPSISENAKGGTSAGATAATTSTVSFTLPPISVTSKNDPSAAASARKSPNISPRLFIATSESVPNFNSKNAFHSSPSSHPENNTDSQTALTDFLKAKTSATSGTALEFHVGGTEAIIAAYYVPILEDTELHRWRLKFVRASYLHSFVRGQEALAIMHILRGNAPKALEMVEDAINVVHGACTEKERCHVLQAICFPRLYALRSCCYPLESKSLSNRSLIQAELWLSKAKESSTKRAISQYYGCDRPLLMGVRDLHAIDNGEWVLMVVVAMRLCGEGKWDGALEEFDGAISELKEVNDKTALFQVRILYSWALFLMGDITGFHSRMRSIKQYTDQVDEPLTNDAAAEVLSFRFSLSCFYDASEILVAKIRAAYTFSFTTHDSTLSSPNPSRSGSILSRSSSTTGLSRTGSNLNRQPSTKAAKDNQKKDAGSLKFGDTTVLNIYHRITEAFLISRSRPKDNDLDDMTDLCQNITRRSSCHHLGGVYLFFAGISAIATYEHHMMTSCEGLVPTKAIDLAPFVQAVESEDSSLADLHVAIVELVVALELQSRKYPILLYFYRSLHAHMNRMLGHIEQAMIYAVLETQRCPADTVPLSVAYLKMEIALCKQMSHDDKLPLADKRENLNGAIASAKEAQIALTVFEAEIEIATLRRCIADCEDLIREMMPSFNSTGKGGAGMTARAYWLDLSCDDDSDNDDLKV